VMAARRHLASFYSNHRQRALRSNGQGIAF
jgi:hypothetical protein